MAHFEREISRVDHYQGRSRSSAIVHDEGQWVTLNQFANTTAELRDDQRRKESSLREELENLKESMEVVESRCSDTEMSYKEFMHFWENLAAKVCRYDRMMHNFKTFMFVSSGVQQLITGPALCSRLAQSFSSMFGASTKIHSQIYKRTANIFKALLTYSFHMLVR